MAVHQWIGFGVGLLVIARVPVAFSQSAQPPAAEQAPAEPGVAPTAEGEPKLATAPPTGAGADAAAEQAVQGDSAPGAPTVAGEQLDSSEQAEAEPLDELTMPGESRSRVSDTVPVTTPMPHTAAVWLSLGAGVATGDAKARFAGLLALSYRRNIHVVMLRAIEASEVRFHSFDPTPAESFTELGVLYGLTYLGSDGQVVLAAGPSLFSSVQRGDVLSWTCGGSWFSSSHVCHERIEESGVGLGLHAQIAWHGETFGIAADMFANVNSIDSMAGATLTMLVGWF